MKIILTLAEKTAGFWDGGEKQVFEFTPDPLNFQSDKFIKWGSWEANYWFETKKGKTDKLSLSYAVKSLKSKTKKPIKSIQTYL